jgi:hypothetical protein
MSSRRASPWEGETRRLGEDRQGLTIRRTTLEGSSRKRRFRKEGRPKTTFRNVARGGTDGSRNGGPMTSRLPRPGREREMTLAPGQGTDTGRIRTKAKRLSNGSEPDRNRPVEASSRLGVRMQG